MGEGANVSSLDALARVKSAVMEFCETARLALSNADADVRRLTWWVQREQRDHWEREIKLRTRKLNEAKSELYRVELQSRDERPSSVIERRRVERCEHALKEAHEKVERCKYWGRILDKEMMLYRGQTSNLSGMLDRDMLVAVTRLNRMMDALEKYIKMTPPQGATPQPSDAWAALSMNDDDLPVVEEAGGDSETTPTEPTEEPA